MPATTKFCLEVRNRTFGLLRPRTAPSDSSSDFSGALFDLIFDSVSFLASSLSNPCFFLGLSHFDFSFRLVAEAE